MNGKDINILLYQENIHMEYFDPQKNWRRIRCRLKMPIVRNTLTRDFNKFTLGRWKEKFTDKNVPVDFE